MNTNIRPPTLGQTQPVYPPPTQLVRVTATTVPGPSGYAQVAGSSVLGPILYVAFTQQLRADGSLLPRDREPCLADDVNGLGLSPGFYLGRLAGSWTSLPVYEVAPLGSDTPDIDLPLIKATESFNTGTLWLAAANQSFQLVLGEGKDTLDLPWVLDYTDGDVIDTTGAPATVRGSTDGVVAQTLASGIAGTRYLQHFSVDNVDTITHVVQFSINFNGTVVGQAKVTLQIGQSLHYAARRGWYIFPPQPTSGADVENEFVNNQTGRTYTVGDSDRGKIITFNNAHTVTVSFPQAGLPLSAPYFTSGWFCSFENRGAGTVTINPVVSKVDGASTLVLTTDHGCRWFSDGANYYTERGMATVTGSFNKAAFTGRTTFSIGPFLWGSWTDETGPIYCWFPLTILNGCTTYAGVPPVVPVSAPTLSVGSSGGTTLAGNYYAMYTDVGPDNAESAPSPESSQPGALTILATQKIDFTLPALPAGVASRNLYLTDETGVSGSETQIASGVTGTTYTYDGTDGTSDQWYEGKPLPAAQPGGGPVSASCFVFPTCDGEPYWSAECGSTLMDRSATTVPTLWLQLTSPTGTKWMSIIGTGTEGDLIVGGADDGEAVILPIGTEGQVLRVTSTGTAAWEGVGYDSTKQQVLTHNASGVFTWVDTGTCP